MGPWMGSTRVGAGLGAQAAGGCGSRPHDGVPPALRRPATVTRWTASASGKRPDEERRRELEALSALEQEEERGGWREQEKEEKERRHERERGEAAPGGSAGSSGEELKDDDEPVKKRGRKGRVGARSRPIRSLRPSWTERYVCSTG